MRKLLRLRKNADTIDALLTVIVVAVMVVVGGVVLGYFQGAINTTSTGGLPTQAASAINNSFSQIWNVWPLTTVIIIVIIVAVIIATIMVLRTRSA